MTRRWYVFWHQTTWRVIELMLLGYVGWLLFTNLNHASWLTLAAWIVALLEVLRLFFLLRGIIRAVAIRYLEREEMKRSGKPYNNRPQPPR